LLASGLEARGCNRVRRRGKHNFQKSAPSQHPSRVAGEPEIAAQAFLGLIFLPGAARAADTVIIASFSQGFGIDDEQASGDE
jgi:hypothetical protein